MTAKMKIAVLAGAAVLIYILLDFLIVTDKERFEQTIADLKKAVECANAEKCVSFVSPDYLFENDTRQDLLELGRRLFEMTGPMEIKELETQMNIAGSLAVYESRVLTRFKNPPEEMLYATGQALSQWRLSFKKEGKKWLIYQVELLSINNQPVRGLESLLR